MQALPHQAQLLATCVNGLLPAQQIHLRLRDGKIQVAAHHISDDRHLCRIAQCFGISVGGLGA
ncbi:hypothetical protein D3C81_1911970 [compost metagenome]